MRKSSRLTIIGTALLIAVGVVVTVSVNELSAGGFVPGSIAPTPQTHAYPTSEMLNYAPGPFISATDAEAIALRMSQGVGGDTQVVAENLETVSAAQAALGSRPAAEFVASTRMVWVVTLKGTYVQSSCSPSGGCLPALSDQVYYVVIDARTGNVFATGVFNAPVTH